jgi:hypothetical protein
VTPRLEDLPPKQQARIRELVEQAQPLTDHQRERLQMLFRQPQPEADDAGTSP